MQTTLMRWAIYALCILPSSQINAQVTFGPEAGFTAAGLYSDADDLYAGINWHIGGTAHFQVNNFLAVRPSLLFKSGSMVNADYSEEAISLNRISIAAPVMYSHVFENNSIVFGGVGPNFMYNLSGKVKYEGISEKIEFGNNEGQLKPIDIGIQFKGGYQFANGLALSMFLNVGSSNLSNDPYVTFKSLDAVGFSFVWMFGGGSGDYY